MIEYSAHAERKMVERNISRARVERVIEIGDRRPDLKNRQRAVAIVDDLETTVIFVEENGDIVVITVWDKLSPRRSS